MKLDGLKERAAAIGARAVKNVIRDIVDTAQGDVPPGVTVEAQDDGVALIGKRLRQRLISDARLRAIGLWAMAVLR